SKYFLKRYLYISLSSSYNFLPLSSSASYIYSIFSSSDILSISLLVIEGVIEVKMIAATRKAIPKNKSICFHNLLFFLVNSRNIETRNIAKKHKIEYNGVIHTNKIVVKTINSLYFLSVISLFNSKILNKSKTKMIIKKNDFITLISF